jgi:predicted RND superfamily exporter protein
MQKAIIRRLLEFSLKNSLAVISGTVLISLFFGYFASRIQLSPDVESLLPEDEEVASLMKKYGGGELPGEFLIIAVESDNLFELKTLSAFYALIKQIENIPEIQTSINPFNMAAFEQKGKRFEVVPLATGKRAPENSEELFTFERRIRSSPIARNLVISSDTTVLAAIFPCERTLDYAGLMAEVKAVSSAFEEKLRIYLSGSIPFLDRTGVYLSRDLSRLLGIAAVIILFSYYLGFRSVRGVLLPFLVVALGTLWCLGFMSLVGFSLSIITIVIPPLVLTLGSSYSIHILNQYYRDAGLVSGDSSWIAGAVCHVNRTILIAAVTTAAGFLSLLSVSIRQIWHFAAATSFGIISCAVISLFFFPAVLSRLKHPSIKQSRQVMEGLLSRLMTRLAGWVLRRRIYVFIVLAVIIIAFGFSVGRLEFTTDTISYFPENDQVVKDMFFLTRKIGGFDEINLTLLAPESEKNYFLRQDVLRSISRLEEDFHSNPDICYIASFVSYLQYLNIVAGGRNEIPESRSLIQFMARFIKAVSLQEGAARYLRIMFNEDYSRLTISLRLFNSRTQKFMDEAVLRKVLQQMELSITKNIPSEIEWVVWGTGLRYLTIADMMKRDLLLSMFTSLTAILLISILAFRSLRFGLYTLLPLLIGVMINFIFMVLCGIPLDATTIMVSSVAIGVGVDDAIHLILQYRLQLKRNPRDIARVIADTLRSTGRPILLTTVSIVCGLAVLTFASFKPIVYFGILVIIALSATCGATVIVLPAILSLRGKRLRKSVEKQSNEADKGGYR